MKIRTLIVDDEAPARARIRQLLADEEHFEIVGECANGRQAIAAIQADKPQLVFLDIQMPRLSGIEVCRSLEKDLPVVVFVTAYDAFALEAFEVHAVDYLLKPFDRARFQKSLRRARELVERGRQDQVQERLAALLADARLGEARPERLAFKVDGKVVFIQPTDIEWVEADGNYVDLHQVAGKVRLRETLGGIETQLPASRFMRISRSLIVNLDRVKEIQPLFYGDFVVIMQNNARLAMSRNFRDRLEKLLEKKK